MTSLEVNAYLIDNKKGAKCYYAKLQWIESGKTKQKMLSTKIPLKGSNKRKALNYVEELRRKKENELKK